MTPTDANGNPLKFGRMYRRVNDQLVPLKTVGIINVEQPKTNEETRYENIGGIMVRLVVPKISREPKEPPVSTDPVIILQSLVTARPYGDYTQDALTPAQINIAKSHEYSEEEFELLLERMNYDEQRYRTTLKRLEQLRTEDKTVDQRKAIEAENARRMKDFMDNLPNRRKLSCGHVFDRRNALDQSRFKKDREFVYCPHGCRDGKLPLGGLF